MLVKWNDRNLAEPRLNSRSYCAFPAGLNERILCWHQWGATKLGCHLDVGASLVVELLVLGDAVFDSMAHGEVGDETEASIDVCRGQISVGVGITK